MCIHEKCGTASRIRNILSKVMIFLVFLVKIHKTTPELYNIFTVWFPKELIGHDFPSLRSQNRADFGELVLRARWELELHIHRKDGRRTLLCLIFRAHWHAQNDPQSSSMPEGVANSSKM